jgi:geranylgeranyl pyrophosphate synthase
VSEPRNPSDTPSDAPSDTPPDAPPSNVIALRGRRPSRAPDAERTPEERFAAELEALMLKLATGERFERLGAIVHEHLLTGNRRARGRLAHRAAQALAVDPERHVGWSAACELLYGASRIHDDIQDRARYRRGNYSVWVRHGTAQAINAGDLMLVLPYLALDHVPIDDALRFRLARAIAERAAETVRGQSLELTLLATRRWDWASYDEAVRHKSGVGCSLPVHGAALLAGLGDDGARALGDAFAALGVVFQLRDELLDLVGDQGPTLRGNYVREGKITGLVVEHLERRPRDLEWLGPLLGKAVDETTDEDVDAVVEAMRDAGSLAAVLDGVARRRDAITADAALARSPALHAVARELADAALAALDPVRAALERPRHP